MILTVTIINIFIISFLLLFQWIYRGEKQELAEKKANIFHVIIAALALALIITAVIALFIFVLHGSTTVVNFLFSLKLSANKLIFIAICFCVYLFVIDGIVEIIIKKIIGDQISYFIVMLFIHILAFYIISQIVGLNQENSFMIAAGVALIVFFIEVLYDQMEKSKK